MLLERKVELMRRYNFDELSSKFQDHGFGNARAGLASSLSVLKEYGHSMTPERRRRSIDIIYIAYGFMTMKYHSIDFEELEREIGTEEDRRDFSTLFKTREILPKLGAAVNRFMQYGNQNGFRIGPDPPEYLETWNLIQELINADRPGYRERLWELEEQLKIETTSE